MPSNPLQGARAAHHQLGTTLVELMVATAIGLFLTAGIVALFASTRQTYRTTEALSLLQENGRFAMEYLSRDLRKTGYRDIINTSTPPVADAIVGWQGGSAAPAAAALPAYTPETDALRIQYVKPDSGVETNHTYYIAPGADGLPALWQRMISPAGSTPVLNEVSKGVFDMQVEYGLDTNDDDELDSYSTTPTASQWDQVVAVRLQLLFGSTKDNLVEGPMSLPFQKNDGSTFTATDRRLYRPFTTTVALRNRLN